MNYLKIDECDMNNGDGIRVTLWVSGCSFRCDGCHNQESWDYNAGTQFTYETLFKLKDLLENKYISGLSILGGEPLSSKNISTIFWICKEIKMAYPTKDIWIWTGYKIDDIENVNNLDVDILIDGQYEKNNPTTKKWRGSDNQRMWKKENNIFKIIS